MVFRSAEKKDIEGMVRLLGVLFSLEEDFNFKPDLHRQALERIIDLSGQYHLALVAVSDAEVRAMLTVQTVVSTATGELSGWVEDVVVDPDFQGKGIGTKLLDRAEKWAAASGITRLQLLADKDNIQGLSFYESREWKSSNMVHRKKMIRPL